MRPANERRRYIVTSSLIGWVRTQQVIMYRFVYASSQWDTTLHCNVVSHWLGAYTNWVAVITVSAILVNQYIMSCRWSEDGWARLTKSCLARHSSQAHISWQLTVHSEKLYHQMNTVFKHILSKCSRHCSAFELIFGYMMCSKICVQKC